MVPCWRSPGVGSGNCRGNGGEWLGRRAAGWGCRATACAGGCCSGAASRVGAFRFAAAGLRGGPVAPQLASVGAGWGLAFLFPAWLWPPCAGAGALPARLLLGGRCPGGTGCSCRCGGGNWLSLVCNSVHGNGAMTPARPHPGPRPRPRGLGLTLGRCCWLCWLLVSLVLAVAVLIHACWRRREDTAPALRPERTPRRRRRRRGRR